MNNNFFLKVPNLLEGKDTYFLLPIVVLLGISVILSVLISVCKIRFLPSFVIEILVGIGLRQIFYQQWLDISNNNSIASWIMNCMYVSGFIFIMFLSGYDNNFFVWKESENEKGINSI